MRDWQYICKDWKVIDLSFGSRKELYGVKKSMAYILLITVVTICLTGCGAKNNAEQAFRTMMEAFQTGEAEKIKPYYDFEKQSQVEAESTSVALQESILATMEEMEYQVKDVKKLDGNTVQITALVTTVNFSEVMNLYIEQLTTMVGDEAYQSGIPDMEEDDYQEIIATKMTESLKTEDLGTEEKSLTLTMVKQEDGSWVPGADQDAFYGGLFGNLVDAVNSLI